MATARSDALCRDFILFLRAFSRHTSRVEYFALNAYRLYAHRRRDLSPDAKPISGPSMSRPSAMTLNSSPISAGDNSFCTPAVSANREDAASADLLFQQLGDSAVDEELRLRGIAEQLQSGIDAGFRDGRKIDVRSQILQAGQKKRVVVRTMAIMAHQRPLGALRVVILAAAESIVDQQQGPACEVTSDKVRTSAGASQRNLADVFGLHARWLRPHRAGRLVAMAVPTRQSRPSSPRLVRTIPPDARQSGAPATHPALHSR